MSEYFLETSWYIPFYGLIGGILTLPWSTRMVRRTGPRPAAYFNLLMTVLAFVHGLIVFNLVWDREPHLIVFHWLKVIDIDFSLTLTISAVSLGAMSLITGLSLLSQLYALGYLEKDWALARFFAMMGFFEAAMSGIALSDSLLLTYGLLEMLTLSTYLLVGFWYAQPLVVTAARDAFLTKRVGDILLLMGLVALGTTAGTLDFDRLYIWAETAELSPWFATLLGLALIAGPTGKCAQFPLHMWLDEAMEGPNPASILRNSVVVACGAYVLIKLQPILALSPVASATLVVIGILTAIGSSLVALAQVDIKRALSHSTSAYLGLVFIAVGTQWTGFALMLLFAHAIAKALLFMSIGSIILTTNSQDLTELGGLQSKMPVTTTSFLVGSAGLVGILPLGGFWALRLGADNFWYYEPWLLVVLLLVNALSALNLTRVYRLVFAGDTQPKSRRAPEVAWPMAVPMVSLIIITLVCPWLLHQLSLIPNWGYVHKITVILVIMSGLAGCLIGAIIPLPRTLARSIIKPLKFIQDLLAYDFYIDRLYRMTVVFAVEQSARLTSWFDRYIIDGLVNLVGVVTLFSGEGLKYSSVGIGQLYVLTIVFSIGFLVTLMGWFVYIHP
ncbi:MULTISPECIES: NAD(P)H-quinone oxidoreductase subunit F [unclassified Roseofilum]|uniref:NAD(P)H-quinone oxidoreductase subunit F n=1 Tax=unclassified Roseofilum TaxID=2620099 RepID=UPI001B2B6A93|nr:MULTISPECIES: NAD(P)H-quinone oxidoreductase subunit F [unclassified Roseofilum]MBP0009341.1 NAD(P)H-quinone oxidoreductase subunit F [Roseofilum sp. Belize Diploria]MBP0034163.1 NAD(P)H-quinone oxidoreductase subunit F [Roseofilum sp. Belize BBD 4]